MRNQVAIDVINDQFISAIHYVLWKEESSEILEIFVKKSKKMEENRFWILWNAFGWAFLVKKTTWVRIHFSRICYTNDEVLRWTQSFSELWLNTTNFNINNNIQSLSNFCTKPRVWLLKTIKICNWRRFLILVTMFLEYYMKLFLGKSWNNHLPPFKAEAN